MAHFINITADKLDIINSEGNNAIVFHIPGHCAGCKRALELINEMAFDGKLADWNFYLIDAENDINKVLIDKYETTIAPTIITFKSGVQMNRTNGLKEFIQQKDKLFTNETNAN